MGRYAYGIRNYAFFNLDPSGDDQWIGSKRERDARLVELRTQAVDEGLAPSAARAGIRPIRYRYHVSYHPDDEAIADEIAAR